MIVSYDGFCFSQRSEPPLNFKIFISSNAFDNSTYFYEQPKFTWLVRVVIAVKVSGEIDAPLIVVERSLSAGAVTILERKS